MNPLTSLKQAFSSPRRHGHHPIPDRHPMPGHHPMLGRHPGERRGPDSHAMDSGPASGLRPALRRNDHDENQPASPLWIQLGGQRGWEPLVRLIYLFFLFLPFAWRGTNRHWLLLTLLSVPVFLLLYFRFYRKRSEGHLSELLAIAALCYALLPFNPCAMSYLTYSAAFAPFVLRGLLRPLLLTLALLSVLIAENVWFNVPPVLSGVAVIVCIALCVANCFAAERKRKDAALSLSQEEIRRLAALAERERIGRDLHDLLGHTLSLVAIKSDLARKLVERDAAAAAREIADVSRIARDALKQVRTAVSGIRAAALDVELLSARALLGSAGIEVDCRRDEISLPSDVETALALIVREGAMNIQRHSNARNASIEIHARENVVRLTIRDDGRGGVNAYGNGLLGLSERVRLSRGTLRITSPLRGGTELCAQLPLENGETPMQSAASSSDASIDEDASRALADPPLADAGRQSS